MTIIGIDLGTTNTCVAVYENDKLQVISDRINGSRLIPSYVAFSGHEWMAGPAAKEYELLEPENTVFEAKRLVGRCWNDPEVSRQKKVKPFKFLEKDSKPHVRFTSGCITQTCSIEEIQSKLLKYAVECAEYQLDQPCKDVVISVPAYFSTEQRLATKRAAEMAGLNLRRLIHEPTAAAIAYGWENKTIASRNVLVYDLGGGTFDVSILRISDQSFTVLGINGDCCLGGQEFDRNLMNKFTQQFGEPNVPEKQAALVTLRRKCELIKVMLSINTQASVFLTEIYGRHVPQQTIVRSEFENRNATLFKQTIDIVRQTLEDIKLDKIQIDEVLMVGGSSRVPKLRQLLKHYFGRDCLKYSINPEEAIACGAAIFASTLAPNCPLDLVNFKLFEVTPRSIGLGVLGGVVEQVICRNTRIPVEKKKSYSTMEDGQTSCDFRIYEGERYLQKDNNLIGQFTLSGIHEGKKGEVKLFVTFNLDESGCLTVSAFEERSGVRNQITIERSQRNSNAQCVGREVYGIGDHKEIDDRYRVCHKKWKKAYDSVFKLKREVERLDGLGNQADLLRKCDEVAEWFLCNELVDEYIWSPKLEGLRKLCKPELGVMLEKLSI